MTDDITVLDDFIVSDDVISSYVRLYTYNSRTAERIFIKFGIKVMPLKATPNLYFLISKNQ
jgi:hypothetical protein